MLWRGARRRCGRCGGKRIFTGYFRLRERCPTCGYRFAREEGFFTGVWLVNFAVTIGLLFVVMMVWIVWRGTTGSAGPLTPMLAVCVGLAVAVPVAGYPFAASTWAALDLAMRPLDPWEAAEAETWRAAQPSPSPP
jgi:uncharacterized protein (DUF983 family)